MIVVERAMHRNNRIDSKEKRRGEAGIDDTVLSSRASRPMSRIQRVPFFAEHPAKCGQLAV